ncbi:MAG: magnesium transporter CorA family protein [archaeon]|jgi:magnesium transporter|nr:magnesium transporter CorA family protein [archaeon]MDD2477372.1 magnesium transporter CorA family protein [Candidatus ainarchaeum sp.]MDD3084515.1 magnesium transporter CorA family protein [Candidatus ainarchaeum sp.]MDD4220796.1 magnesium transporter CorA family protein [Candidatus ainarchaeum sp.]MDD4662295.1 magnesium transporter CorA family protein [Candidatus ainarchaeum sp.]
MIQFYKPNQKELIILKTPELNCWINVYNPNTEELEYLSNLLKIKKTEKKQFIEDLLSLQDQEEIPMLEKLSNRLFIITRTVQKKEGHPNSYYTTPLGILLTKDYAVTIGFIKNTIIKSIKEKNMKFSPAYFILRLLLLSSRTYLTYLKEIDKQINSIEQKLESSPKNIDIKKLLYLEKSLVFINTSLKGNQILFERMYKNKQFNSIEKNRDVLDDVIDENKQGIEMAQIYTNIIKNNLDVNSSVISNNLNKVVKILTSITIIIAIPTLVASIYGMNVNLPFQQSSYAFGITMLISLFFTFLVLWFLWKNKWL